MPIAAHALLADTRGAALVAADGTADWWCRDAFDAPPLLYGLLTGGGRGAAVGVTIAPPGRRPAPPVVGTQSVVPGSLVATTVLQAGEAVLEVSDFLPWEGPGSVPPGRLVRMLTARRGPLEVRIDVVPGAGWSPATRLESWSEGVAWPELVIRTGCALEAAGGSREAAGRGGWTEGGESGADLLSVATRPGDVRRGYLRIEHGAHAVITLDRPGRRHQPLSVEAALELRRRTIEGWHRAVAGWAYEGSHGRALAALAPALVGLMTGAGAGAGGLAGAATTSLPLVVGGERNLDRRGVAPRVVASAVGTLEACGLTDRSVAAAGWLNRLVAEERLPWAQAYDHAGRAVDGEDVMTHVDGWGGSQPVRIGWPDRDELGGDVDGLALVLHTVDPVWARRGAARERPGAGGETLSAAWEQWVQATDWLADHWDIASGGPWQLRGPARRLVAPLAGYRGVVGGLRRMASLARARNPLALEAIGWRDAAAQAEAWLEDAGRAPDGGWHMDGSVAAAADAALLLTGDGVTVDRILGRLGDEAGWVAPYAETVDDGFPSGQGASVVATAWAVQALARLGRWDEAHRHMDALAGAIGPTGLLPEQVSSMGAFLGNLPSTWAHLAVLDAGRALAAGPR